uniref:Uncharacterized protein n=1 Tax=Opuntia streptacantha TaxID=393608 RepID=A0A7C9DTF8_OPUST
MNTLYPHDPRDSIISELILLKISVAMHTVMASKESLDDADLPKLMNFPHNSAIILKFSQLHPCGGTPTILNHTLLESHPSSIPHFLISENHCDNASGCFQAISIRSTDGNDSKNL